MEKIIFTPEDGEQVEFFVLEQTLLGGINYILVTDSQEEEAEALYEIVEDDSELEAVSKIFQEMLEDVEIDL